ncbi:hypothetical protein BH24ACT7_BH24ACT7_17250 [soil metagenome]
MDAPLFLSSTTLVGDPVVNREGDKLGELVDIMLDTSGSGRIAYGVIGSGGILGMGKKLFAVPWSAVAVDTDNKALVVDVDKDTLDAAPGFDPDHWPQPGDGVWAQMYRHYGFDPYWEDPAPPLT